MPKKKKKKAWTFLTTCEFKADEMPPAFPIINSADEVC